MRRAAAVLLLAAASSAAAQTILPPPQAGPVEPATLHYAEYRSLAEKLAAEGRSFSGVFQGLNAHLLESGRLRMPMGEVRSMLLGLAAWTREGGRPMFQGRADLALHFIYAAYGASNLGLAAADAAAYEKERRDSAEEGNTFDLDDLGASYMGARWVEAGRKDLKTFRAWIEQWADGRRSLDALPELTFGRMPPRTLPPDAKVEEVRRFADGAMR